MPTKIIVDKHKVPISRFGAALSQGLIDAGGRNGFGLSINMLFTGMMRYLNDNCSFCCKYGSDLQVGGLDGASPDESDEGSHSRTKDT
jgi:hypothetical protein